MKIPFSKGSGVRIGLRNFFFVVTRTVAVLHGGANKDYFSVIHTTAVRI